LFWKLSACIAAGCTAVIKPAEETTLSALYIMELIEKVGFPAGSVNLVSGRGENVGVELVKHPLVDKVSFTGSTDVGREII
jgi:acyl-CoA reductase-like NAD-dependent aldehyde dehydrogenase